MFQRVLWVSLTQSLRTVALVLLPCAFISLLAWATAGSTEGHTTDPMRVAAWAWLAAHHIPFDLLLPPGRQVGVLSYLPVGALIFPFLALRSSFVRAMANLEESDQNIRGSRLVRSFLSIFYTGIALFIAWSTATSSVKPSLYWVPVATLPLVWISTSTVRLTDTRKQIFSIDLAFRVLAIITGISSLVLAASLFANQSTIKNLTLVLQPGWLGGILLLLLGVLYIPNAIIATLSYLIGPGFSVGADTSVSALVHKITEIPALPILGALPTARHPMVLVSAVGISCAGIIIFIVTMRRSFPIFVASFSFMVTTVALLGFLSSGELMTSALSTVGVSTWKFALAFGLELAFGALLAWLVPWCFHRLQNRIQDSREKIKA